jgi:hypothetical protein
MGLLDDAIREHLELKRRRGADPSDVARQEVEALGPVRRTPLPDSGAVEPGDAAAPEGYADEAPLEPSYEHAPEPEVHAQPESESSSPPHGDPLRDEAFGTHGAHEDTREFSAGEVHEALGRGEDEPAPPSEIVAGDDFSDGEEDVLEETPDFLQETPEHDRLWFEQKPPKDFDF